jgi:hypothetical protein
MFSIEFGNVSMFQDHDFTVLQLLYCFSYITKCNPVPVVLYGMGRACNTEGEKRNAYRILVGKPEGKRPLRRPSCIWVNNIKWILERWDGLDWIYLDQDRDQ